MSMQKFNSFLPPEKPNFVQPKPESSSAKSKVYICVDVDSFFAQCDSRKLGLDNSVPLVHVQWGVCVSANYAARAFGVKGYMLVGEAKKLCPHIVVSHADTFKSGEIVLDPYEMDTNEKLKSHDKNTEKISLEHCRMEAEKIFSVLEKYCGIVEKASFDEAFMDVTEEVNEIYRKGEYKREWLGKMLGGELFEPENEQEIFIMIGTQIAEKMRAEIEQTLKYTCSAGIAHNKMLCKLGSGLNKPNGQAIFCPRYTIDALKPISISKLRNFGKKITGAFEERGLTVLAQVHDLNVQDLQDILGDEKTAKWVYFRARGHDDEEVKEKEFASKSIMSSKNLKNATRMEDLIIPIDLILTELHVRLLKYFEKYKMVPRTLTAYSWNYNENKGRSKSTIIDLKRKTEDFRRILQEKGIGLVETMKDVLFPCSHLSFSVKDFEKSDFSSFKFDLLSHFSKKNEQKQIVLEDTAMKIDREEKRKLPFEELQKESNINTLEVFQEEKMQCERCEEQINKSEIESHMDFHAAMDLDKQLNPNKKKYKPKEDVSLEMKRKNQLENKEISNIDLKRIKKTAESKTGIKEGTTKSAKIDHFFFKR